MFIENIENLDKDSLNQRELYDELLSIESELDRQIAANRIRKQAKELGQTKVFDQNYSMAQKEQARFLKQELANSNTFSGECITDFSLLDEVGQLKCGEWVADDDGVRLHTDKGLQIVCPHPIFISKILKNAETGKYKVELIYKIRGKVQTIYANRETIATPSKILKLADDGVQVTAITAPLLVKYLADLEALNPELIKEQMSTSRLGWIEGLDVDGKVCRQFLPYMANVIFDNELSVKSLFDSIKCHGDKDKWYKLVKEVRAKRQPEILINLAASFASVLVEPIGTMPFVVSLWGESGKGKSVVHSLCASVWADPGEGKYIISSQSTIVGTEILLNILNSLPLIIDDTATIKRNYDGDFSQLIYGWCEGKGKTRGNKELGLNKLTSWRNCILVNGETALVDEYSQAGAINRVIDIEMPEDPLITRKDAAKILKVIENNYGYAGDQFIFQIICMTPEELAKIYNEFGEKIEAAAKKQGVEKEDKQVVPMALILTADYLIEKYLFHDGVTIDIDKAVSYLKNKGAISEDSRAYEYLMNVIAENSFRFDPKNTENGAGWGYRKDENTIVINGSRFDAIVKEGGFQSKAFLAWCKRKGLVEVDGKGNPKKVVSHQNNKFRAVVIKTDFDYDEDEKKQAEDEEMAYLQAELPFQ